MRSALTLPVTSGGPCVAVDCAHMQAYKARLQTLMYNLRDAKNGALRARVCAGDLAPASLASMTTRELANPESAARMNARDER